MRKMLIAVILLMACCSMSWSAEQEKQIATTTQTVVVKTVPENGDMLVDPSIAQIKVTFSKKMTTGKNYSWMGGGDTYPKTTGDPRWLADGRTCVLPVKLEPGKTYQLGMNSQEFQGFRDVKGRPAVPFVLTFHTRGQAIESEVAPPAALPPNNTSAGSDSADRVSRWRGDIDFFAKELPAKHKDFYDLISKNKFDRSIDKLRSEVPQLTDLEIMLRLKRLVASINVAHTNLELPSRGEQYPLSVYPIRMQWFADKLAVVRAARKYRDALGCHVVRIGSMTPEKVEETLAPYISSESKPCLRIRSPKFMTCVELMQHENIADSTGHLKLTCAKSNGEEFSVYIEPVGPDEKMPKMISAVEVYKPPALFRQKNPDAYYWYEYLPDSRTLYIQYDKCADEPGRPFAEFAKTLFDFADSQTIDRVVVDLRSNGGGASPITKPLLEGIKLRPALNAKGRLYVLIGGHTFSSAMFAAVNLQKQHAILVGEPTGNKPNHFGQVGSFELPNSKLKVTYATKRFHMIRDSNPPTLRPDIYVPCSLEDYLAGRDPVLDAVLRRPVK